jgi:hypothetical protein
MSKHNVDPSTLAGHRIVIRLQRRRVPSPYLGLDAQMAHKENWFRCKTSRSQYWHAADMRLKWYPYTMSPPMPAASCSGRSSSMLPLPLPSFSKVGRAAALLLSVLPPGALALVASHWCPAAAEPT